MKRSVPNRVLACAIAAAACLLVSASALADEPCEGDVDGNGRVTVEDLVQVLVDWGPCPGAPCPADIDGDGEVGIDDLLAVVSNFGCE